MCVFFFVLLFSFTFSLFSFVLSFFFFCVATSRKFNGDRWLREHEEKLLFAIYEDGGWRVLEDESADCKLKSEYSINEYSLGRFKSLWREGASVNGGTKFGELYFETWIDGKNSQKKIFQECLVRKRICIWYLLRSSIIFLSFPPPLVPFNPVFTCLKSVEWKTG